MTTDRLDRDKLEWIIGTYDLMVSQEVPDVPTLLFDCWAFSEQDVRHAIGLQPGDDLMDGLEAYLEEDFGICDLA